MKKIGFLLSMLLCQIAIGYAQAPHVVSTSPAQNELNVSINTNISVTFDIDMDETTINESTFVVNARSTGLRSGVITYDGFSRTATFDFDNGFAVGEVVMVSLTTGIKSSNGTPLDNGYVWSFTIEVSTESPGTFVLDSTYTIDDTAIWIIAADLNNDGYLDLATSNYPSDNASILFNNSDATFTFTSSFQVGDHPERIFAADFDADTNIDLATSNYSSGDVTILINNGDSTFITDSSYTTGGGPYGCAADLDGDGDNDIATANFGTNNVSVVLNNGDGTFTDSVNYTVGSWPHSITAADFDNDYDIDLATANTEPSSKVISILINDGNGNFSPGPHSTIPVGSFTTIFAADLDNDYDIDLAITGNHQVHVYLNDGLATFTLDSAYSSGADATGVFASDVDGDGDQDLLTPNASSGDISIFFNNGDGTFDGPVIYPVDAWPTSVFAADFDNDGDLDFATANYRNVFISVFLNEEIIEPIPTLSEWGMIILGLLLLALGTVAVVRRRKAALSKAV